MGPELAEGDIARLDQRLAQEFSRSALAFKGQRDLIGIDKLRVNE